MTASRALAAAPIESDQNAEFAGSLSNLGTDSQDDIHGNQAAHAAVTIDNDRENQQADMKTYVTP